MKVTLPDGWHEVSVGDYQEMNQTDRPHEILSILMDEDPEIIRKMDPQSASKIYDHLSWIKKLPDENRYMTEIWVDDTCYKLVENLNAFCNGEWIDMDEYVKDFNVNMHLVLAMLYRPDGEYRAEDVASRAKLFQKRVMIGDVYGAFVFFSHVAKESTISSQDYLSRQLWMRMRQKMREKKGSKKKGRQKNGAGIHSSTR